MENTVVKVNGKPITDIELERAISRFLIQLEEDETAQFEPTKENLKYIKTEVLNHMIERSLLLQRAEKEGVSITPEAIERNIAQLKANFASEDEWAANLTTLRVLEENIVDEIKNDMMVEKLLHHHYQKEIVFSEEQILNYYQDNERLMKEPDLYTFYESFAEKTEQVKLIYYIIQNAHDSTKMKDELASIGLEFQSHADVPAHMLPEEVFKVLSDLKVGEIASMQAPDKGVMVYKMVNKTIGKKLEYEQIKEKLAEYLIQHAKEDVTDRLIHEERDNASIIFENTDSLTQKAE